MPTTEEALPSYDDSRTAASSTSEYSLALDADSPDEVKSPSSDLDTGSVEEETVVSEDETEIPELEVLDWDEMMQDF